LAWLGRAKQELRMRARIRVWGEREALRKAVIEMRIKRPQGNQPVPQ
jgi:hypothetical protein